MNEIWYLIDNNVLTKFTRDQRASTFLRQHCRLPNEVLNEASGFPDIDKFQELEYPATLEVLEQGSRKNFTLPY